LFGLRPAYSGGTVTFSTRISTVLVAAALALGAAFPVTAWARSEESSPPPSLKHGCQQHKKQKHKEHHKHKCKKHEHKGDTKPDHEPPPPPPDKKGKCNAGNGNGSDAVTFVEGEHCYGGDPGNSFKAGNRGGDEIPTTVPPGVPNPGGNNHPGP
jgi:hypothetical protein